MQDKTFDVVALGELLIDFTQNGKSEQGNLLFEANPGGAPANVLAMLRKLGRSAAFIGKVGQDAVGDILADTVHDAGIDCRGLRRDKEVHTTLAVVHTFPGGDRDFSFYRKPGADVRLEPEELDRELLKNCKIFHFGSLSLTEDPVRQSTMEAVRLAKEADALVTFDPNLREPLWDSPDQAREQISWGLGRCDVVKIADNELLFMTGERDFDAGAARLREQFPNLRLVCVTAGAQGSYAYCGENRAFVPGVSLGGVIETTGAGDTFCACMLNYVLSHGPAGLSEDQLREMLRFANAAAYIVTTRKGAIRSMPDRAQVEEILKKIGEPV